jgi:Heavy metal binding domain
MARSATARRRGVLARAWLLASLAGPPLGMAQAVEPSVFVCPMHPEVLSTAAGPCPRCGMALVKGAADARDYRVEMETMPAAPRAGSPVRLRLTVRHPGHGGVVRDFAIVHDRAYHLFVIRQDLEDYQHVHPQSQADGSLVVDVTLARPGYYRVYSDFFPRGGTAQVVPGVLVTTDAAGDLGSSRARLVPDVVPERRAGDIVARLGLPSSGLVAGREEKLALRVQDARGSPVLDLEPHLGAYGHALVLSEDTLHYVHAHPVERLAADAEARGGPDLTFKALLPKPGRYRIWVQVKRAGVVSTLPFTVEVASPAGAGG